MSARAVMAASLAAACLALVSSACIGGQPAQTKKQSDALGDQSGDVPPATLREHDWSAAATGHGAAGKIPPDELARLERRSAPGGNLDAGAADASAP